MPPGKACHASDANVIPLSYCATRRTGQVVGEQLTELLGRQAVAEVLLALAVDARSGRRRR